MRTHQNSDLLLVGRPVIIDSLSTAYFSFNSHMASQGQALYPLVDPTSRELSGAANAVVGSDQMYTSTGLMVPGKFGNGLTRDESTTNTATGIAPWTNGINEDVSLTEPGPILNSPTWKFIKTGSSNQWNGWEGTYNGFSAEIGECWTISGWYKTSASAGVGMLAMGFYLSDWSRSYNYTILSENSTIIADGQWHHFWKSMKLNEVMVNAIIADGPSWGYSTEVGVLYINGLQWEKKGYYSSFADGTRPETYLQYPSYPVRTVSTWVKSTSNKVVDGINIPRTILRQVDQIDTYPQWSLYTANTNTSDTLPGTATPVPAGSATLKVKWKTDGVNVTSYLCTVSTVNILDGGWHHITCEFGLGSICRVWVDDKYGDTLTIPETNYSFNGLLRVGYDSTSELAGNFLIDELRLDNKNYTIDDIRKRYLSGVEYYNPYSYQCIVIGGREIKVLTWDEFDNISAWEQEQMTWNNTEGYL